MVISYTIDELNAIGEMVTLRECLSKASANHEAAAVATSTMADRQQQSQSYRQLSSLFDLFAPSTGAPISATDFLRLQQQLGQTKLGAQNYQAADYLKYQAHDDNHNRSLRWKREPDQYLCQYQQPTNLHEQRQQPLTNSVAEFFKKAQQNFHPQTVIDPSKVRHLSDLEAELIKARSNEF